MVYFYIMQGEFLAPLIMRPHLDQAAERLRAEGLAFEYFPAFCQRQHLYHTHPFVEMLYVLNGSFRHVTADRTYDESAGGLTILNYNQYHTLKTPHGPVELINVYWDLRRWPLPVLPGPLDARLHELIPMHPMLGHRLNQVIHLQFPEPERPAQILQRLYREQQEQAPGSAAAIEALFRLFLIELCRTAPSPEPHAAEPFNPLMEKVRRHLEQHYAEPVRLEQLCELTGLRPANLCRRFKAYTGLTTGEYLTRCRLAEAVRRLRGGNEKIATLCFDCGFSDLSNFNRTFRRVFGKPPSAFRHR